MFLLTYDFCRKYATYVISWYVKFHEKNKNKTKKKKKKKKKHCSRTTPLALQLVI